MNFWAQLPYLLLGLLVLYTLISPAIDWLIYEVNWTIVGPVWLVLYVIWWSSGLRRKFWNKRWRDWNFES